MKPRRYLRDVLLVKNFTGTGIKPTNLLTLFFIMAAHSLQAKAPSGLHGWPQMGSQYSGDPSAATIATLSVTSNRTQSLYTQEYQSICLTDKFLQQSLAYFYSFFTAPQHCLAL